MKLKLIPFYAFPLILLVSCGNGKSEAGTSAETINAKKVPGDATDVQQNGIVGQWEQQYTCFDKNGNSKLEPEEKNPSNTRLGFNWFHFKADGTCLRDKDVKFEGTYEIQEKNETKRLIIQGGDRLQYTITELTSNELILGADGAFIVFKRIK